MQRDSQYHNPESPSHLSLFSRICNSLLLKPPFREVSQSSKRRPSRDGSRDFELFKSFPLKKDGAVSRCAWTRLKKTLAHRASSPTDKIKAVDALNRILGARCMTNCP